MLRHGAEQNDLLAVIEPSCDAEEWSEAKLMIAQVMGEMWWALRPLLLAHPDLKPPYINFAVK